MVCEAWYSLGMGMFHEDDFYFLYGGYTGCEHLVRKDADFIEIDRDFLIYSNPLGSKFLYEIVSSNSALCIRQLSPWRDVFKR